MGRLWTRLKVRSSGTSWSLCAGVGLLVIIGIPVPLFDASDGRHPNYPSRRPAAPIGFIWAEEFRRPRYRDGYVDTYGDGRISDLNWETEYPDESQYYRHILIPIPVIHTDWDGPADLAIQIRHAGRQMFLNVDAARRLMKQLADTLYRYGQEGETHEAL